MVCSSLDMKSRDNQHGIWNGSLSLTLMLLVANLWRYKMMQKPLKMTGTLANGYSSKSTRRELSNEYQHGRVKMFFKNLRNRVFWTKVALALEGLTGDLIYMQ